jgi:ferric-dicitrate binding protein FerR (iron transport regulator)
MLNDRSDSDLPDSPLDETAQSASMWLARINRGLHPGEVKELRNWLKVAKHRPVILDMARLYHGPDIVAVLSELFPAGPEPMKSEILKELAKAAVLATIVVGLAFLAATGREPWMKIRGDWEAHHTTCAKPSQETTTGLRGMYSTAVGGKRELTLPDHSTVTLNTHTCMGVAYSGEMRLIVLPYGEATFHVVHDKHRPFFVRAGSSRSQCRPRAGVGPHRG